MTNFDAGGAFPIFRVPSIWQRFVDEISHRGSLLRIAISSVFHGFFDEMDLQPPISGVDDFVNFPLVLGRNGSLVATSLISPLCVLLHAMVLGRHNIKGDESGWGHSTTLCVDVLNISCDFPMGTKGAIGTKGMIL